MINALFALLWQWIRDAQFHKMAASTAAGTSIGFVTLLGIMDNKIDDAKAEMTKKIEYNRTDLTLMSEAIKARKELTDERFQTIEKNFNYLKAAADITNANILRLYEKRQ